VKTTGKIFTALCVLAVLAAAALYLLFSNLDRIVAAAIEQFGSEATGTKVTVSSVRIALKEGTGSVRGLAVGNPAGFSSEDAIRLEDIEIALDTASVTANPVVVDRIVIRSPRVLYEVDDSGGSNLQAIRRNVESFRSSAAREEPEPPGKEGRKFVIRRLNVEKGTVTVRSAHAPDKPLSVSLPAIELRDLGGRDGDSPEEIAAQIAAPLTRQATLAAAKASIGSAVQQGIRGAGEALKKIFGK